MTDQYQKNNINSPRGSRTVSQSGSVTLDDGLIVCETSDGPIDLSLPSAAQIPGQVIEFKSDDSGTSGNSVTISAASGESIDGSGTAVISEDQGSVSIISDGSNWRRIGGGGVACCPPQIGLWYDDPSGYPTFSQQPSVNFRIPGSNFTGVVSVVPLHSPLEAEPVNLPTVNGFTVVENEGAADYLDVDLNTSLSDGPFYLEITNECGCTAMSFARVSAV